MPLSLLWSAQVSDVFVLCRLQHSVFRFQGLAHAVEDAVRLLVASLDVTPVVVVVNVILVPDDEVYFLTLLF